MNLGSTPSRTHIAAFWLGFLALVLGAMGGCVPAGLDGEGEILIYGKRGLGDAQFQKPRAIALGPNNLLYVIDMTARIQVFDLDGNFLRSWRTPEYKVGKPCGLEFSNDGMLMVADTHYYRVLFYSLDGELDESRTIGGVNGTGPGEFGFVTDVVQDAEGNYYISEYGDYDRIQKFDADGNFIYEWGGHGEEPGEFLRPQDLAIDEQGQLWVADASNHRIQVFDISGDKQKLVRTWGAPGREYGQMNFPYDLFFHDGHVFVCEFGAHRIQKFTLDGEVVGSWGQAGREEGQLQQPWAMCIDQEARIHLLDTYNQRIQRFDVSQVKAPSAK
jgi:sugar lactone lactonase YvrE